MDAEAKKNWSVHVQNERGFVLFACLLMKRARFERGNGVGKHVLRRLRRAQLRWRGVAFLLLFCPNTAFLLHKPTTAAGEHHLASLVRLLKVQTGVPCIIVTLVLSPDSRCTPAFSASSGNTRCPRRSAQPRLQLHHRRWRQKTRWEQGR